MLSMSPFEVFLGRTIYKFQAVFINAWASQRAFQTLENISRVREKVHEVQTYQGDYSNSDPP